jgi:uncharacterized protein YbjQ (UPF0145 family)
VQQAQADQDAYDARSLQAIQAGRLPLRAQERLARMQGRAFTSALSVPAFATVHGVGFDPVGQVLGSCVYQLGWAYSSCGYWGYGTGYGGGYGGFGGFGGAGAAPASALSVVDVGTRKRALRDATGRALSRLAAEAGGLGADGVVDVTLTWTPFEGMRGTVEVQAIGTAVRGRGSNLTHLGSPFLSDLSGQDVSVLLRSGYAPTGVAVGIAVCVRHDDYWTRMSSSAWAGNQEIPGVTDLITTTRHRARESAAHDVASLGGTALVVKAMSLRTWEQEPGEGHRDHLAEASVVGTSVVAIGTPAHPPARKNTLSILRLDGDRINDPRRQSL